MIASRCFFSFFLLCAGCGDDRTRLQRSCDGERVGPFCEPYQYAVVEEASLEPMEIRVGEPAVTAMVHVRLRTCGEDATGPHEVRIEAVAGDVERPDGGSGARVYMLATVSDDGSGGDTTARDGLIDVTIPNPFGSDFPAEADVELEFEPFLAPSCVGDALGGVPYRSGVRWMPDAGR